MKSQRAERGSAGKKRILGKGSPAGMEFRRLTLADQVAATLRRAIREGQFSESLPAERELCRMLYASRPVIRQALHILKNEGLLSIGSARSAGIVRRPRGVSGSGEAGRVTLLFAEPRRIFTHWTLMVIDDLRRELHDRGFQFEVVVEPGLGRGDPRLRLEKLVRLHRSSHWILAGASRAVQEWFQANGGNVISMGNVWPGIKIPFVNDDQRGVARHATGVLLGFGHQAIVLLRRDEGSAGESIFEAGFHEAFSRSSRPGAQGIVFKHPGRLEALRDLLPRLFLRQPRPTGLIISHAEDALVVVNWMLEKKLRVPTDVSLISYQWQGFLEWVIPRPAWYFSDPKLHARKLCRLVLNPPQERKSPRMILPAFFNNGAVAAPSPV